MTLKYYDFRMEYHTNGLKKVCMVCGKRLKKAKGRERSYLVLEYSRELAEVFQIDSSADSEGIHPVSFCHSCRVFMRSWHTRGGGGGEVPAVGRVFTWERHSEPHCTDPFHT